VTRTGTFLGASPPVDLAAVQVAFGLPPGLHVVTRHPGSVGAWQLRSADGDQFSLKLLAAPAPDYQREELRHAALLERAAPAAGMDIVEPVEPLHPEVGLCAAVGPSLAWVHRWVPHVDQPTRATTGDVGPRWLGGTLARLHTLVPASLAEGHEQQLAQAYGLFPSTDWAGWFDEAELQEQVWTDAARAAAPALLEATSLGRAALTEHAYSRCITHRDVTPRNVLPGPNGPVLCDFSYAGVDVPWLEAVGSALSFGPSAPKVLSHYLSAGGSAGTPSVTSLARRTGFAMNWLAYSMWLSLGHRHVHPDVRAAATRRVPQLLNDLTREVERLDDTGRELFG